MKSNAGKLSENKRRVREPVKADPVPRKPAPVVRAIYWQDILRLAAVRLLDMLWVKNRMLKNYDAWSADFKGILELERVSGPSWKKALERRLVVLGETVVASRKLTSFAEEAAELLFVVKKLVAEFVSYFKAAERDLGIDPPRWMVIELAKEHTAASSPRQREWVEFYSIVNDSLPPGDDDRMLRLWIQQPVPSKVQLSSTYGKFGR